MPADIRRDSTSSEMDKRVRSQRRSSTVRRGLSRFGSSIRNVAPNSLRRKWRQLWKDEVDEEDVEKAPETNTHTLPIWNSVDGLSSETASYGPATFHSQLMSLDESLRAPLRVVNVTEAQSTLTEMLTSRGGNTEALRLIQQGGDVVDGHTDYERNVLMLQAALSGRPDLLHALLNHGADLEFADSNGMCAVHMAALSGSFECTRIVTTLQPQPVDTCQTTPLHCAVWARSEPVLTHLCHIYTIPGDLVHTAVRANALKCLHFLLKQEGVDVDVCDSTGEIPLNIAADTGHLDALQILLDAGAQLHLRTCADEATALHLAAEGGHVECVRKLLAGGAHPQVPNYRGQTPLHLAARMEAVDCVEVLLDAGVDPNVVDQDGRTPLHNALARECHSYDVVNLLMNRGANVNQQDQYGYTALHLAALNELNPVVDLLLRSGADISLRNSAGTSGLTMIVNKTPASLATIRERLNGSISIYDPETRNQEVELKFDFHALVPHGRRGEICLFKTMVADGQKDFLKHPLCRAFLFLKWRKVQKYFYARILFCSVFIAFLTLFVLSAHARCEAVDDIGGEKGCDDFVPMVAEPLHYVYSYILMFLAFLHIAKEVYLILVAPSWKSYVCDIEHVLFWTMILSVFLMTPVYTQRVEPWQRYVGAVSVLLAWAYFMLLVGQLPIFGMYVQMFSTVLKDLFRILVVYVLLLLGFTFSLSVLYAQYTAFRDVWGSFVKVVGMMIGEIEFSNLVDSDSNSVYFRFVAHSIILVLMVLVTIVLMNLMIGMAVRDIQELEATAGLLRLVQVTDLVGYMESMFLSPYWKYLPTWFQSMLERNLLLSPASYRWVFIVRPLDMRDTRLPRDIVTEAYQLALSEKHALQMHRKVSRFLSNTSFLTGEGDMNYSQTAIVIDGIVTSAMDKRFGPLEDNIRTQIQELTTAIQSCQNALVDISAKMNTESVPLAVESEC